ncbi:MAG: serine/threonine-protein kinase [Polyangiaceae bacterium]
MASGGMASVHLGRLLGPVGFSKIVAIKRLHEEFAADPEFLSMFIAEARLASAISHPNVVSTLDVVVEGDELLLVMEYVQGETLSQLTKLAKKQGTPAPLGIIQRIVCDALDGLHAAHTASVGGRPLNIVHRDVSPQNIMVGVTGVARVLDFGIAQAASRMELTRPGQVKGKISYLSPEQLRGLPLDARTDVFSAGVVLWESLTGRRLFHAEDLRQTVDRLQKAVIPKPSTKNPAVSSELDGVVMKALERDCSRRFASAAQFADALRRVPGEATRAELGAWVRSTASQALAQRLEALEELEAVDMASAIENSEPLRSSVPVPVPLATYEDSPTLRIDTEPTVQSLTLDRTRSLVPNRTAHRRRVGWALSLALLASCVALLAGATSLRRVLSPTVSIAHSSAAKAPSGSALARHSQALTEPAAPLAVPSGELDAPAPVPTVQLDELVPSAPTSSATQRSKLRLRAKAAHPEQVTAAASNCNPPYRIDASGVRRVRFECL